MRKIILGLISIFLAIFGLQKMIESQEKFSCDGTAVVVQKNDIVWDLVVEHCSGNIEVARNHIVNSIGSSDLVQGQTIMMTNK